MRRLIRGRRVFARPVRLLAGGDVYLGDAALPRPEAPDPLAPFRDALAPLGPRDLLVVNVEGPITASTTAVHADKACNYRMPPEAARILARAGVDLASLANNHVMDHGPAGLAATRKALDAAGIRSFGAGDDAAAATAGVVAEIAGVRIGFLAFMEDYPAYETRFRAYAGRDRPGVARLARDVVRPAMRRLRRRVDVLVVAVHWGLDYGEVTGTQRTWARQLAEYGADLVLGHHPHVVQGVGREGRAVVVYSLGNLVFGGLLRMHRVDAARRYGWVADVTVHAGRIAAVSLWPLAFPDPAATHHPRPVPPEHVPAIVARVQRGLDAEALEASGGAARVVLPSS